ncbi:restriction endonuclease subunit S [Bifidobacterium pseudolongum]|uniref:restriction endonuclease subunit S n=1 Tax=Bifidobacterium pseudolongum TaxID=1694 RepID=UPI001F10DC93|nr:restriction endonuclease subunit S [Bifidobacterium pseudolongum]MCH4855709.1 restriction endonuclease subunit S [Bifidobacterium pseudolongum]
MMSAKNLRDSILQMAVEGKLVEQREEEGTAVDLLASIREQRAQLVREKKAKPVKGGESVIWRDDDGHWFERRGKGKAVCIDDEIPFDIPDSWCWAHIESVCENIVDCPHSTPHYENNKTGYYAIDTSCINDEWEITNFRYVDKWDFEKRIQRLKPEFGDLVFTREGSIGRSALLPDGDICLGQRVMLLRTGRLLFNRYLQICLTAPFAFILYKSSTKGTAAKHINVRDVCSFLIPIPPFTEQRRIVAKLDKLMPHIDGYGKAHERREQLDCELPIRLRKSILRAAVEGKLTEQSDDDEPASVLLAGIREKRAQLVSEGKAKPVKGGESIIYRDDAGRWFERRGKSDPVCIDEEIPFDIPDSWCWARLSSLGEIVGGGTPRTSEEKYWSDADDGIPWITPADMKKGAPRRVYRGSRSISKKGLECSSARLLPEGTVLMSSRAPIGYLAIAGRELATNQGFKSLVLLDMNMNEWVLLTLEAFMPSIQKRASGTTFKEISGTEFGKTIIPIPPFSEQNRLVGGMHSLLDEAEALQ